MTPEPSDATRAARPPPRRGVTLVEMLVTVAVLVIIMTVMVQIFQSATGALTAAQTIQELTTSSSCWTRRSAPTWGA